MKLYRFKPPKLQIISTINLWRWRMHEEHTKSVKNKGLKHARTQRFIVIPFQRSLIHPSAKLKYIWCSNQNHITIIPIKKSFKEIESKDYSFVISKNCTTHWSIQTYICETILLVQFISKSKFSHQQV